MRYQKTTLSALVVTGTTILASATAHAQEAATVNYDEFALGRFLATVAGLIGLACAIFALVNMLRMPKIPAHQRTRAIISGAAGLAICVYGIVHLAVFTGDFGTGDGRAGAIISIVLGLLTTTIASMTVMRHRSTN